MSHPTLSEAIERAIERLTAAGVASPRFDAWALASHCAETGIGSLQAQALMGSGPWTARVDEAFWHAVDRRVAREPLWRITGKAPFIGLELSVGPGVFTPRPETELLAQTALEEAASLSTPDGGITVVDLCAGSGAIGLWLAHQLPQVRLLSVELSSEAAEFLSTNLEHYASGRSEMVVGDIEKALDHRLSGEVDLVVSNPPYLIPGEELDRETATADPPLALFGGPDGLEVIARVVQVTRTILRPGGLVLIEHGVGHRNALRTMCEEAGFAEIHTEVDLLGRDRFTRARLRHSR